MVSSAPGHDWTIFILSRFGEWPRPTGWSRTHSETGYWVRNGRLGTLNMTQITDLFYTFADLMEALADFTHIKPFAYSCDFLNGVEGFSLTARLKARR